MKIDWWTLGLQTINVVVLIWLLQRFLFQPVSNIIAQRQAAATALLDDARMAKSEAETERQAARAQTESIAAERAQRLKAVLDEVESQKAVLLAAARAEADKLRQATVAEIEKQRVAEVAETERQAIKLSIDIASKLMERLPEGARVEGFIEGLASSIRALPHTTREQIGSGVVLQVKAPRVLTPNEVQACHDALDSALGRRVEVNFSVDPNLLAGFEIDMPHARIRNSLRADLERIATQLAGREHAVS
jgi:F-type H+-transporting ATPase subunit b